MSIFFKPLDLQINGSMLLNHILLCLFHLINVWEK
jgi:hypothetical protein